MKLPHKIEYACRVLAQLARIYGQEKLARIDTLADAEQIPANYLVQILNELRNQGLIISKRGKQGGYALAKAPETIGLADIVRAIESELLETNYQEEGQSGVRVAAVWCDISDALQKKISEYTLEDLVVDESNEMYYI